MLRELLDAFRSRHPLNEMGANFGRMVNLTGELVRPVLGPGEHDRQSVHEAGEIYFGADSPDPAAIARIRQRDVEVNALQRTIRRQVVAHLSFQNSRGDVPYSLLLVSLVKDVERLGDYAKNLSEVRSVHPAPLPDDAIVIERSEQMHEFVECGRTAVAVVMGTRFYKRFVGHIINLLTGIVQPLHKLDYYDEDEPDEL